MALDEPQENDEIIKEKDITFLIQKELLDKVKPIIVDFIESPVGSGFRLSSNLQAGGNCGSSCSSC
jgi:Fe-S cluster assembly iron-binding protein IscA